MHAWLEDTEYQNGDWLTGCRGFRVDSPRSRLGYVDEIHHDPESGRPTALVVRRGTLAGREVVPVEEIAGLLPGERLIVLRGPWPLAEDGARSA